MTMNMRKQLISALLLLTTIYQVNGQKITLDQLGFKHFTINDKSLGEINYYISSKDIDKPKPILLYLDGSGAFPLFQYTERGIGSSVVIDFRNLSNEYHIILISKPGVPFLDSVKMDTGIPIYKTPKTYKEKLSLDWRVNSAKLVLNKSIKKLNVANKKVAVIGLSEGFQVGAKLASIDKNVSHLMLFVGNGLNQIYDFIIQNRTDTQSGAIPLEIAQKNIDSLYVIAKDIYENPNSTDKEWYGHTYLRWSSFTNNNPSENILSLNIPVYIVAAANDRNTSVLGTDYLYLESIRQKKKNIFYTVFPVDHSLNEPIKDENGKIVSMKNHRTEILNASFEWLKGH
jgi:hypothetical protein